MSIKANKDNAVFISNAYLQEEGYKASATVTFDNNPLDGHTISLNGTVFTYRETPLVANDVQVGVSIEASIDNLLTEALPSEATYTKVGTDSIFIEYATIGVAGNSYTISSNFTSVPSTLSDGSDTPDGDWIENTPTVEYNPPELYLEGAETTSTALVTVGTVVAENDQVRVYNATDGLVDGVLGTTTTTTTTVYTHDIFADGGIIATYQLDGNANDLGGTYNGTATDVTYATGKFGQAAVFNGTSSYISGLPNNLTDTFTINLWFKDFSDTTGSFSGLLGLNRMTGNGVDLLYFHGGTGTGNYTRIGGLYVESASWKMLTFVVNAGEFTGYIDAISQTLTTTTADTTSQFGGGYLGKNGRNDFSGGSIDQVRIFNRALTAGEVTTLYNEEVTKYISDITSLALTNPPTKAWLDKPITVSTVTEANEARCIAQDETLTSTVTPTLTTARGTSLISGVLETGDDVKLDGTLVTTSGVVETDLGDGTYQYDLAFPTQGAAPTTLAVPDRSIAPTEASDIYDNIEDKFTKTFVKVEQQGRAFKYKIEADDSVEVSKITIPMNRQP